MSVHLNVQDACVLVHFAEAVDEPNMMKTQCGMAMPTVSLTMAHMHPLHVVSVCMVHWACCNSFPAAEMLVCAGEQCNCVLLSAVAILMLCCRFLWPIAFSLTVLHTDSVWSNKQV